MGDVGRRQTRRRPVSAVKLPDDVGAEWAKADELVLSKLRDKLGLDGLRWADLGRGADP